MTKQEKTALKDALTDIEVIITIAKARKASLEKVIGKIEKNEVELQMDILMENIVSKSTTV